MQTGPSGGRRAKSLPPQRAPNPDRGSGSIADRIRRAIPRKGLEAAAFYLTLWFFFFGALGYVPSGWGALFGVLQVMDAIGLIAVAIPLALRFVRRRLLWSLRSRLILTYLLFGLAPVVLGLTLVAVFSYFAAGQFAIHLMETRLAVAQDRLGGRNEGRFGRFLHVAGILQDSAPGQTFRPQNVIRKEDLAAALPGLQTDDPDTTRPAVIHTQDRLFLDGIPIEADDVEAPAGTRVPLGLPAWAASLPGGRFNGVILDGDELYVVAMNQRRLADNRMMTLVTSLPINGALVDLIAEGLGRAELFAIATNRKPEAETGSGSVAPSAPAPRRRRGPESAAGGAAPLPVNLADVQVRFFSTVPVTDWDTGLIDNIPIRVDSRPSLLYKQLFGGSLAGVFTSVYRTALLILIIVFALLEALALYLAIRLGRTITTSVADLYAGTQSIDRGDLNHRIPVTGVDQLSDLGRSFNSMTGSLQRLLVEQKEKERLQNELSIAQEVQANLFPHADCDLANLQLHGVCRPARSVSGDYYDFILFHSEANLSGKPRTETGVGIALGDISGKGISAALLMATLHSAVRAYRFASEEVLYAKSSVDGLTTSREEVGDDAGELFQSPGRILSLLNRHLYRSTQPEKYATLFLAHYDAATSWMTYSNAGQLPPLVLSRDGSIRRLDKGGTVVGLMDGMKYEEDGFQMRSADIMVAYSDGVTEPENDFGDFGEERLMEVVARYRDEPLHVISAQVMQALDAWIGAEEQPDDITLVLARQL
jgi:sigma-B regulation protein RsbU (phosphoserine phosphatase)